MNQQDHSPSPCSACEGALATWAQELCVTWLQLRSRNRIRFVNVRPNHHHQWCNVSAFCTRSRLWQHSWSAEHCLKDSGPITWIIRRTGHLLPTSRNLPSLHFSLPSFQSFFFLKKKTMFSSVLVPAHFHISSIHLHSLKPCSFSISCPVILPSPFQFTTYPQPLICNPETFQPIIPLPWNLNVVPHLVITPLSFLNTLLSLPHPTHHLFILLVRPSSAFHCLLSIQVLSASSEEESSCDRNSASTPSLLLPDEQTDLQTGCYIFPSASSMPFLQQNDISESQSEQHLSLCDFDLILGKTWWGDADLTHNVRLRINECESVWLVAYQEGRTASGNFVSHHQTYR